MGAHSSQWVIFQSNAVWAARSPHNLAGCWQQSNVTERKDPLQNALWTSWIWWLRSEWGYRTKRSKRKQGFGRRWLVRCGYHLQKWECPVAKLAFKTEGAMSSPKLISQPSTFRGKQPKWWEHLLPRKRMGQISVHGQRETYFSVIFSWNFWILYYCMYYLIKK